MVIGVAGKFASGKDQAVLVLQSLCGPFIIDVDSLGHKALETKKETLTEIFGAGIIDCRRRVDRKKLGNLVFKNNDNLLKLESVVHPVMRDNVEALLRQHRNSLIVINAALLFYMGLDRYCDTVLWVSAPLCARIRRARQRDKLTIGETISRFRSQKKLKHKQIQKNTDIYTIRNNGSLEQLQEKVAEFLEKKGIQ